MQFQVNCILYTYSGMGANALPQQRKIIVSLPESLLSQIDDFVCKENTNRSKLIREATKLYMQQKRKEELAEEMKKGYIEMGKINLSYAEHCLVADNEVLYSYEEKLSECE